MLWWKFNPLLDPVKKDLDRWAPLPLSLLDRVQIPSSKGGLDLLNIRWYQLASHLRFIAEWVQEDPTCDLLNLEKSQTTGSLLGLLVFKDLKSARSHCKNNPIICNTFKAWFITQKIEGKSGLTSPLVPIQGLPNFLPGMADGGYST